MGIPVTHDRIVQYFDNKTNYITIKQYKGKNLIHVDTSVNEQGKAFDAAITVLMFNSVQWIFLMWFIRLTWGRQGDFSSLLVTV